MCRDKTPWGNQHTQENGYTVTLQFRGPDIQLQSEHLAIVGEKDASITAGWRYTISLISCDHVILSCLRQDSTHVRCMLREATHRVYLNICVC